MTTMENEWDDLKLLVMKVALKEQTYAEEEGCLKGSLKETLYSIKELEKEASSLKDELMSASDQYFENAKYHVAFFYQNLDLSQMDMFKVV